MFIREKSTGPAPYKRRFGTISETEETSLRDGWGIRH